MAHARLIGWLILASVVVAAQSCTADDEDTGTTAPDPRSAQGLEIAPVPLDLAGRDRDLVGLGSYIVNAQGACNDCHTCPPFEPGRDPFLGQPMQENRATYLAGGRAFGPVVAPNITPDAEGRPGGLTRAELVSLMRTGRDPDEPGRILQVMPWHIYGQMTDRDLTAMYEYLSAIPPASAGTCE